MNIVKCTYIIDGNQGQYIPQIFAERYPEWLEEDDKAILLDGPDNALSWFSPDSHNDELANAALSWLNTRLKEKVQP